MTKGVKKQKPRPKAREVLLGRMNNSSMHIEFLLAVLVQVDTIIRRNLPYSSKEIVVDLRNEVLDSHITI